MKKTTHQAEACQKPGKHAKADGDLRKF